MSFQSIVKLLQQFPSKCTIILEHPTIVWKHQALHISPFYKPSPFFLLKETNLLFLCAETK